MTSVEVIARQAKRIEELSDKVKDLQQRMKTIRLHIICIGGPLNDNKLKYTPAQLVTFARILEQAED